MQGMFSKTSKFSKPFDTWNVSNKVDRSDIFLIATKLNQLLNGWILDKTDYSIMFEALTIKQLNIDICY